MVKVVEQKSMSRAEVADMPAGCAWHGCTAYFKGTCPPDWRWLLVYWDMFPAADKILGQVAISPTCDRDALLCPEHARQLEAMLKSRNDPRLEQEPAGAA